jgi:hypothetical protein
MRSAGPHPHLGVLPRVVLMSCRLLRLQGYHEFTCLPAPTMRWCVDGRHLVLAP